MKRGIGEPLASSTGLPPLGQVVGDEDVAGRRLRVAADAGADEVLGAALQLVGAGALSTTAGATAAGQLLVVALFGVGRVEIRRVVEEPAGRRSRRASRNGEFINAVLVPPLFRNCCCFCEYCSVANRLTSGRRRCS